jgi:hypothetical protein
MIDKDYNTKDSREKKKAISTEKTVNSDLVSKIEEVLKSKEKLTPYLAPMLELINEKNEATSTDEQLLKMEKCYKERMEKLKGPKKNAGTTASC